MNKGADDANTQAKSTVKAPTRGVGAPSRHSAFGCYRRKNDDADVYNVQRFLNARSIQHFQNNGAAWRRDGNQKGTLAFVTHLSGPARITGVGFTKASDVVGRAPCQKGLQHLQVRRPHLGLPCGANTALIGQCHCRWTSARQNRGKHAVQLQCNGRSIASTSGGILVRKRSLVAAKQGAADSFSSESHGNTGVVFIPHDLCRR